MMRTHLLFFTLATALPCLLAGQATLDKPLVFDGEFPEQRQLTGLAPSTEVGAVLSAAVEQAGTYRLATGATGNVWATTIPALIMTPPAGTHLLVVAPATAAGPITLSVNGGDPYPVLAGPGEPVDGARVPEGTIISMVMDGTAFQIMNGAVYSRRDCPEGTVAAGDGYCIETVRRAASDFFQAAVTCNTQGLRLCGWGEFIAACQRRGELELLNMTSSWEWTNDASNENNCARIAGAGSCLSAGNALVTGNLDRNFRCCYSR